MLTIISIDYFCVLVDVQGPLVAVTRIFKEERAGVGGRLQNSLTSNQPDPVERLCSWDCRGGPRAHLNPDLFLEEPGGVFKL